MKAPKLKFTNIKHFEGMDGIGLNADVYINGTKCLKMIDDGNGGELMLRKQAEHSETINKKIQELNDYVETLSPKKFSTFELPMTVEMYLDDMLIHQLEQKEQKRFEKMQETAILFGKPKGKRMKLQFNIPLKRVPASTLQKHIDGVIENYCKPKNYQILNTNLDGFNIKV